MCLPQIFSKKPALQNTENMLLKISISGAAPRAEYSVGWRGAITTRRLEHHGRATIDTGRAATAALRLRAPSYGQRAVAVSDILFETL